jgi:putative flippase GtrA
MVRFAGLSVTMGNSIAWIASVSFAFIANKKFVFQSRSWKPSVVLKEGSAFFGARLVSGLMEIIGVPFVYHAGLDYRLFGIDGFVAKLSVSVIIITFNYIASKFFIFRKNKDSAEDK